MALIGHYRETLFQTEMVMVPIVTYGWLELRYPLRTADRQGRALPPHAANHRVAHD